MCYPEVVWFKQCLQKRQNTNKSCMLKAPHSERNNRMRRKGLNIFTLLSYEKSAFIKKGKNRKNGNNAFFYYDRGGTFISRYDSQYGKCLKCVQRNSHTL